MPLYEFLVVLAEPYAMAPSSAGPTRRVSSRQAPGPPATYTTRWDSPPLGLQGAVEPLHLAVLPGTVRLDELLLRPDLGDRVDEGAAVAVGEGVVGHHPLDAGDAHGGEVGRRPAQEVGAGQIGRAHV